MNAKRCYIGLTVVVSMMLASGCSVKNVDFSNIAQPPRSSELDAYEVFVGSWDWEAKMLNASEGNKDWTGTARWHWSLDNRVLEGRMESKSGDLEFQAMGVWSWHPKDKKYIWWMINNWGYPHSGTARYNKDSKEWTMNYRSVGLDGTTSHGRFIMNVVDSDTLAWKMEEWVFPFHLIKKTEMVGTYKRRK